MRVSEKSLLVTELSIASSYGACPPNVVLIMLAVKPMPNGVYPPREDVYPVYCLQRQVITGYYFWQWQLAAALCRIGLFELFYCSCLFLQPIPHV